MLNATEFLVGRPRISRGVASVAAKRGERVFEEIAATNAES